MDLDDDEKKFKIPKIHKKKFHSNKRNLFKLKIASKLGKHSSSDENENYADEEYMDLESKENKIKPTEKTTEDSDSDLEIAEKDGIYCDRILEEGKNKQKKHKNIKKISNDKNDILNPILKFLENKRKSSYEMEFNWIIWYIYI